MPRAVARHREPVGERPLDAQLGRDDGEVRPGRERSGVHRLRRFQRFERRALTDLELERVELFRHGIRRDPYGGQTAVHDRHAGRDIVGQAFEREAKRPVGDLGELLRGEHLARQVHELRSQAGTVGIGNERRRAPTGVGTVDRGALTKPRRAAPLTVGGLPDLRQVAASTQDLLVGGHGCCASELLGLAQCCALIAVPCLTIALISVLLPAGRKLIPGVLGDVTQCGEPLPFDRDESPALEMPVLVVVFGASDAIRGSLGVGAATLGVHLLSFERDLCPRSFRYRALEPGFRSDQVALSLDASELVVERSSQTDIVGMSRVPLVEQPFVFVSQTLPLVGEVLSFVRELLTLVREPLTFVGGGVPQIRTVRTCARFRRPR